MPEETQTPKEATTPGELLNQWAASYSKLIGWLTSFGGQTGHFGHMPDIQSATAIGMLAVHIQDAKLRETLLAGVAEFVNRFTLLSGSTSARSSCLALEESISVQTELTAKSKAEEIAQLDSCKALGYIGGEEYTLLLNKLENIRVGTVLQVPGH